MLFGLINSFFYVQLIEMGIEIRYDNRPLNTKNSWVSISHNKRVEGPNILRDIAASESPIVDLINR